MTPKKMQVAVVEQFGKQRKPLYRISQAALRDSAQTVGRSEFILRLDVLWTLSTAINYTQNTLWRTL